MERVGPALAIVITAGWLCAPAQAQTPQLVPDLGKYNIKIDYYAPRDAQYDSNYQKLQQRKVLEELGQFLAPVKWPKTFRLIMKQCSEAALPTPPAYYSYDEYSLTVCYQLFRDLSTAAGTTNAGGRNASFATSQQAIVGGLVGIVLHEAARAAFDMLQIPVLGSDEDSADQLAGIIGLQFGPAVAQTVIKGTYLLWNSYDYQSRSRNLPYNFASNSSVPPQRANNILCIAYGGDQADFKALIDQGLLPPDRAADCIAEYRRAAAAFDATFKPHVDASMMTQALSMTWITSDDLN
jgi:hypothetical protein